MASGTYTLVVRLPARERVEIGALGEHVLPAGWYAYTGSAFGPGGFARVDRHHEMATGQHETRHWHVDYLLGESAASIRTVVRSVDADVECSVATAVAEGLAADAAGAADGRPGGSSPVVDGFGASDCDCPSHLHFATARGPLVSAVRAAHDRHRGA